MKEFMYANQNAKNKNRNAKVEMSNDYEIFSAHVSQFLSTFTEVNKKVNRTNQKCKSSFSNLCNESILKKFLMTCYAISMKSRIYLNLFWD